VLVWVVAVVAYVVGMRGISRNAVIAMTVCVAAYMLIRMLVLNVGSPSLAERASGFGFSILEPADLIRRFDGRAVGLLRLQRHELDRDGAVRRAEGRRVAFHVGTDNGDAAPVDPRLSRVLDCGDDAHRMVRVESSAGDSQVAPRRG
jgi:hypothetical protein